MTNFSYTSASHMDTDVQAEKQYWTVKGLQAWLL